MGVEPTRHVERVSPDLKSERPTGVRSSSMVSAVDHSLSRHRGIDSTHPTALLPAIDVGGAAFDSPGIAESFGQSDAVEILQQFDNEIAPEVSDVA